MQAIFFGLALRFIPIVVDVQGNDRNYYTVWDDASWAIQSTKVTARLGDAPHRYREFIRDCQVVTSANNGKSRNCAWEVEYRLRMNTNQPPSVYNYIQTGYKKIKAPKELHVMIHDYYVRSKAKAQVEWDQIYTYHNTWKSPPTIVPFDLTSQGSSTQWREKIWDMVRPLLEEWTGQILHPVSLYGMRIYYNQSILAPNVGRMPLVTSAIRKSTT